MAEDKTKELLQRLETGIRESLNSERYKAFLRVQAQFHNYSYNNTMLIYLQRPDATRVAGYNAWKKLDRHVMAGEKGIGILAPAPYKYEKPVEVQDPVSGETRTENITEQRLRFTKVTVFDLSQTDGKELPTICNELQGNSVSAENIIKAVKQISDVPIVEKELLDGSKGYYSRGEQIIAVKKGMSLDQTAKTLVHELAHSKLHSAPDAALLDRATKEVQAESTAFIVSERFGLDTSDYSFDYLASWSSGKELPELKASFNLIQKTANEIIEKMEDVLTKELTLQNNPVNIKILWSETNEAHPGETFSYEQAKELLESLDKLQSELRQANEQQDYSAATAGDNLPYTPYLKTKIQVILSDGRTGEARFDLGESGYRSLAECIKKECYIDVEKYIQEHITGQIEQSSQAQSSTVSVENKPIIVETTGDSIKAKIVAHYVEGFPAIKHISEKTAQIINDINENKGKPLSIRAIKDRYTTAGKLLEQGNNAVDMKTFKELKEVVDDLKQAQLTERQIKAQEKTTQSQLSNSKGMAMVQ